MPRMSMLTVVVALAAAALTPGTAAAGSAPPAGFVSAIRQLVTDGNVGALGYARTGDQDWSIAAGRADVAIGEPADPGDRFRIASNTKAFVATVMLQLVGEGRLSLDDPVDRWLPGVVSGNGNDGARITVRELLNHTSGIYDPTTDPSFWRPYLVDHDWSYVYRPREVVAMAMRHAPVFPPGGGYGYSNTNYLLAGLIIEAVTGDSPVHEIYRRIIGPLGLWHTSFPLVDPVIHGQHLHGYDLAGNDVTTISPSYDWTAGAMISTVGDLAAFYRALYGGRLLAPAQQRDLETTVPNAAGLPAGLGTYRLDLPCEAGRTASAWENDGGGPGFYSVAATSADGTRQVIVLANVYDIGQDLRHAPPFVPSSGQIDALRAVLCE